MLEMQVYRVTVFLKAKGCVAIVHKEGNRDFGIDFSICDVKASFLPLSCTSVSSEKRWDHWGEESENKNYLLFGTGQCVFWRRQHLKHEQCESGPSALSYSFLAP
jgi:hypothetical protein